MATYSFINRWFLEVDESTREFCFIKFDSGTVNLFGKIIYQDQSEFDYILDLIKKFDSEVKKFLNKNEYNPLYNHNPTDYSKYRDKKKAVKIILMGLDIVNKLTKAKDNNLAIVELIENEFNSINDSDHLLKSWLFRLTTLKRVFEIM